MKDDLAEGTRGRTVAPHMLRGTVVRGGEDRGRVESITGVISGVCMRLGTGRMNVSLCDKALNRACEQGEQRQGDPQARRCPQHLEEWLVQSALSSANTCRAACLECDIACGPLRRPGVTDFVPVARFEHACHGKFESLRQIVCPGRSAEQERAGCRDRATPSPPAVGDIGRGRAAGPPASPARLDHLPPISRRVAEAGVYRACAETPLTRASRRTGQSSCEAASIRSFARSTRRNSAGSWTTLVCPCAFDGDQICVSPGRALPATCAR